MGKVLTSLALLGVAGTTVGAVIGAFKLGEAEITHAQEEQKKRTIRFNGREYSKEELTYLNQRGIDLQLVGAYNTDAQSAAQLLAWRIPAEQANPYFAITYNEFTGKKYGQHIPRKITGEEVADLITQKVSAEETQKILDLNNPYIHISPLDVARTTYLGFTTEQITQKAKELELEQLLLQK